jgi:hypothetical protein
MRKTRTVALCSLVALAIAACSDSTEPGAHDLEGNWAYTATISSTQIAGTCSTTGTIDLNQSGSSLDGDTDGTISCTGPGGTVSESGSGSIDGSLDGDTVTFDDGECTYTGTVQSENAMGGNLSCAIDVDGTAYPFTGTWSATRS